MIGEESGVFEAFGHDRAGKLLPAENETEPGGASLLGFERQFSEKDAAQKMKGGASKGGRAAAGFGKGLLQKWFVAVGQNIRAVICAIDGQTGSDFLHASNQFRDRHVLAVDIGSGKKAKMPREEIHVSGEKLVDDLLFALVPSGGEIFLDAGEPGVAFFDELVALRINKQNVESVQKAVTGGASAGPFAGKQFVARGDFFDDCIYRGSAGISVIVGSGNGFQAFEILEGIEKAVNVVHAKAGDFVFLNQAHDGGVARGEDNGVFAAKSDQIVDVEKTPIVNFGRGQAPVGEAIRLGAEKFIEAAEGRGFAGCAVQLVESAVDNLADERIGLIKIPQFGLQFMDHAVAFIAQSFAVSGLRDFT